MSGYFNMLMGLGQPTFSIGNAAVSDIVAAPGTATATLTFESDGDIMEVTSSGGTVDAGDWIFPKSFAPGPYSVRADIVSGTPSSGTTGSDLALTSNRSWNVTQAIAGTKTCTLTFSIKNASGVVLKSGNVVLTAQVI